MVEESLTSNSNQCFNLVSSQFCPLLKVPKSMFVHRGQKLIRMKTCKGVPFVNSCEASFIFFFPEIVQITMVHTFLVFKIWCPNFRNIPASNAFCYEGLFPLPMAKIHSVQICQSQPRTCRKRKCNALDIWNKEGSSIIILFIFIVDCYQQQRQVKYERLLGSVYFGAALYHLQPQFKETQTGLFGCVPAVPSA